MYSKSELELQGIFLQILNENTNNDLFINNRTKQYLQDLSKTLGTNWQDYNIAIINIFKELLGKEIDPTAKQEEINVLNEGIGSRLKARVAGGMDRLTGKDQYRGLNGKGSERRGKILSLTKTFINDIKTKTNLDADKIIPLLNKTFSTLLAYTPDVNTQQTEATPEVSKDNTPQASEGPDPIDIPDENAIPQEPEVVPQEPESTPIQQPEEKEPVKEYQLNDYIQFHSVKGTPFNGVIKEKVKDGYKITIDTPKGKKNIFAKPDQLTINPFKKQKKKNIKQTNTPLVKPVKKTSKVNPVKESLLKVLGACWNLYN